MRHYQIKLQRGYILLAVLIFMQILTLYALCSLSILTMTMQASSAELQRWKQLLIAKQVLGGIEKYIGEASVSCMISFMSPGHLIEEPGSWWQEKGCVAGRHYYYVVEALGNDSCGMMEKADNNQVLTAHYYRITLISLAENNAGILLQSTIAKPGMPLSQCRGKPHSVFPGRQMWRELS